MFKTFTITDHERGLLVREGRLQDILEPGRHQFFDPLNRVDVDIISLVNPIFTSQWALVIEKERPDLRDKYFEIVRPKEGEIGIVSLDGAPFIVVPAGNVRVFWKVLSDIGVEMVDVAQAPPVPAHRVSGLAGIAGYSITTRQIEANEEGLLYVDGEYRQRLKPGRHAFWSAEHNVDVVALDLREQALEVTAQELLTKDRVSLRLTLTAFWKIVDVERAASKVANLDDRLYKQIQFAIRSAVAGRTLDELLNVRSELDVELTQAVREAVREDEIGVMIDSVSLKDIILPGDMREILNQVVEAEKQAQANLIRRKEETAATRSLLNTARLMESNPLLLRLKEVESLEKLTEKIGRIDFHAGETGGLDSLMTRLISLKGDQESKT